MLCTASWDFVSELRVYTLHLPPISQGPLPSACGWTCHTTQPVPPARRPLSFPRPLHWNPLPYTTECPVHPQFKGRLQCHLFQDFPDPLCQQSPLILYVIPLEYFFTFYLDISLAEIHHQITSYESHQRCTSFHLWNWPFISLP